MQEKRLEKKILITNKLGLHARAAAKFVSLTSKCESRFVVKKGSIAIDGVSLTVNEVSNSGFNVMIIPHTLEKTTFNDFKKGTRANIEYDMLARYVQNQKD